LSKFVIRNPADNTYALSWHALESGLLTRIEWVEKRRASSYTGRSEAKDVLAKCPPGVIFERR
jgi:hypothetical protein